MEAYKMIHSHENSQQHNFVSIQRDPNERILSVQPGLINSPNDAALKPAGFPLVANKQSGPYDITTGLPVREDVRRPTQWLIVIT